MRDKKAIRNLNNAEFGKFSYKISVSIITNEEFERLEDLEDDLTTVYLNGVYDGEKKVEDKIKAKIEEYKKGIK